jgi:hypothetical protein
MAERDEQPTQTSRSGLRIPVPTREDFDRFIAKVAGPPAGRKDPDETDEPPERSEP